jgi:hypothetical protein
VMPTRHADDDAMFTAMNPAVSGCEVGHRVMVPR